MTNVGRAFAVLLSCSALGCGTSAAAPFSDAEQYAQYVTAGKQEAQHDLHDKADDLWQAVQPQLAQLSAQQQALWWVSRADVLQFEHRFDEALAALQNAYEQGHYRATIHLMQARIALTQADTAAAQRACQQLADYAPMDVTATCLLEVKGRNGELSSTYPVLKALHARNNDASSELSLWRRQLLAEQAHLLGAYDEALHWLQYRQYQQQPVVMQKQIIEIFVTTQRAAEALTIAGGCPTTNAIPVDSLIVRFAHAEQVSQQSSCWRELAQQRIDIRVLRGDRLHAADLAYYFTYVTADAERALQWAQHNSDVAQEPFDQQLLAAAKELQP